MLAEAELFAALARLRAAMFEPPGAELRERPGQVLRRGREAVPRALHEAATPASLHLQLVGERLRLGLGARLGGLAPMLAGRVVGLSRSGGQVDYATCVIRAALS